MYRRAASANLQSPLLDGRTDERSPAHADAPPTATPRQRVLSGMRPTGAMHLGHYHGALKNWVRLQDDYDCFYFVADWHALTTHYEEREVIEQQRLRHGDRLARRRPRPRERARIFIQSRLPEHAELFTLLAMGTPLGWLERVPTYKDQIEKLKDRDLATYGFLGYPLLQAADILIYKAAFVPVGEDQASHVELTREVARRFNHLYGRAAELRRAGRARRSQKLGKDDASYFESGAQGLPARTATTEALAEGARADRARSAVAGGADDRELLTATCAAPARRSCASRRRCTPRCTKLPGLDGAKMSKSYGNAIAMREEPAEVERRSAACPPTRRACAAATRATPRSARCGSSTRSTRATRRKDWVVKGCTTAGIGCLDCKQPVIDAILREQQPWRERAEAYLAEPEAGALDRRGRHRAGAHGRARDDARRARRDGAQLLTRSRPRPRKAVSDARRVGACAPARAGRAGLAGRSCSRCRRAAC